MKQLLLATSALAMSASFAAAELSYSGSASLTYGGYGTGTVAYDGASDAIGAETDFTVTMTGEAGGISYSAALELDESGNGQGAVTMSSGGLTLKVDADDIGGLAVAPEGGDGEDDNYGDVLLSYSSGGVTVSYEMDNESDDYKLSASYKAGDLTLDVSDIVETGGDDKTTAGLTYALGDITIAASADDQDDWDASVSYSAGDAKFTVATDETAMYSVGVTATLGNLSLTARQEFSNPEGTEDETELSLGYSAGDLSVTFKTDTGQTGKFGDEAESTVVIGYALADGIAFEAKANDQEEMEMSIGFTF